MYRDFITEGYRDVLALKRVILFYHGTIFGGFVRDSILGIKPKDIDVMVPDDIKSGILVHQLLQRGSVKSLKFNTSYYKKGCGFPFSHYRYLVWDKFYVDIVTSHNFLPDCNINRFTMSGLDQSLGYKGEGTIISALCDLHNKEFVAEEGCPQRRVQKMLNKGFKVKKTCTIMSLKDKAV